MRFALAASATIACLALSSTAHAQAVTTRIETRPYYGAITTIEHGVRVTRALPPHDRIIINPHGKANVSISVGGGDGAPVISQNSQTTLAPAGSVYSAPTYVGPGYFRHGVRHAEGRHRAGHHGAGHQGHGGPGYGAVRILRPHMGHRHP